MKLKGIDTPPKEGELFDQQALGRVLNNMKRIGIKQLLIEVNEGDVAHRVPVTLTFRKPEVDPEPITVTLVH